MIHYYKQNGYNIVLDIYSGSIHIVDDITFDAISLMDSGFTNTEIYKKLSDIHRNTTDCEIFESLDAVQKLKDDKKLFSDDLFKDISVSVKTRPADIKALCLNVSHSCNLACEYCFAGQGNYKGDRATMSLDVAEKSIDFLLKSSRGHRNLDIDFFGGEPLLNLDVVKKTIDYARSKEKEYNKRFRFTFTTNGIDLNDDNIAYLNENMDNIVLSLDGRPHIHDRLRKSADGKGSYHRIVKNFQKLVEARGDKEYYIRGTYTAANKDFLEDIRHIAYLGFKRISLEPVVADPQEEYALCEDDLPLLFSQYEELVNEMLKHLRRSEPLTFYHYMLNLKDGPCIYKRLSGCGSAVEYLAVTPWGDLYPCHQFIGDEDFLMGNVYIGIQNHELQNDFKQCNCYEREECRKCWAKLYCSGGCAANAYHLGGNLKSIYPLSCKLFRKRIECAITLQIAEQLEFKERTAES